MSKASQLLSEVFDFVIKVDKSKSKDLTKELQSQGVYFRRVDLADSVEFGFESGEDLELAQNLASK